MMQQDILLNGTKAIVAMVNDKPLHEVSKNEILGLVMTVSNSMKNGDNQPNDTFMNLLKGYLLAFDELGVLQDLTLREVYIKIVEAVDESCEDSSSKPLH